MPVKAAYQWFAWLAHRRGHAFLVLIVLLVISAVFLVLTFSRSGAAAVDRRNAYEGLVSLERLLGTIRDAETGQRGYLLTNKPEYLEPYNAAVGQFADRLAQVRTYRPFPADRIDEVERQAREKFAELDGTIALSREGRRAEALAIVQSDRGKHLMDVVRASVQQLQRDERARVEYSENSLAVATAHSFAVFVAATTITVVLVTGLIVSYSREERARVRAEAQVKRQAARYSAINRAAPGAIVTADAAGLIDEWNPAAEHTFGWAAAEIIGRPLTTLIPERYRHDHLVGLRQALAAGAVARTDLVRELAGLRRDGTEFPADVFVDVFAIEGVPHAVGIVRDITPRKHMEARQEALRAELERSNTELQAFAYVASHDLQEPLRMVDKFVRLLAEKYDGQLDDQAQRYIGFAVDGARRMQQLIGDLLRYSRVTTKARPPTLVNMNEVFREVQHDLAALAERAHGQVVLATGLPVVTGEAFQLRQLLLNLAANGLKFHRPGVPPVVTVACSGEPGGCVGGECWHFAVSDNGIGIDPAQAPKLFQLFTRLHAREEYEGTGVGLAICKKIVERHGGRIWVESVPGSGSTFHFIIPKEPQE